MSKSLVPGSVLRPGRAGRLGTAGRSKRVTFGLVFALSVLGLASCGTPSNTPTAYDSTVESNFMDGCQAKAPPASTGETGESLGDGASEQYCQCAYNWFVDNVPYSSDTTTTEGQTTTTPNPEFANFNFKDINSDLVDDPGSMPQEIVTALAEACGTSDDPGTPGATTPTTEGTEVDPDNNSTTTTSTPG